MREGKGLQGLQWGSAEHPKAQVSVKGFKGAQVELREELQGYERLSGEGFLKAQVGQIASGGSFRGVLVMRWAQKDWIKRF